MGLIELVEAIKKQATTQKKEEQHLLEQITTLSDYETAKAAEELFKPEKHAYSFDGYLHQLEKVRILLQAGLRPENALEQADTCIPIEQIMQYFKEDKACRYQEN